MAWAGGVRTDVMTTNKRAAKRHPARWMTRNEVKDAARRLRRAEGREIIRLAREEYAQ